MADELIGIQEIHKDSRELEKSVSQLRLTIARYVDFLRPILPLLNRITEQGLVGPQGPPGPTGIVQWDHLEQWQIDILRGLPGKDFTYDMFMPEQLENLRGPQGPQGPPIEWHFAGHFDYDSDDKALNPLIVTDWLRAVGIDLRKAITKVELSIPGDGVFIAPRTSLYKVTMVGGGGGGQTGLGDGQGVPTNAEIGRKYQFGTMKEDGVIIPLPERPWTPGKTPQGADGPGDITLYKGGEVTIGDSDKSNKSHMLRWGFMEIREFPDGAKHPIFVMDRNVFAGFSWDDAKRNGFVDGKPIIIDGVRGIARLLEVGDDMNVIESEWDKYIANNQALPIPRVPVPIADDLDGVLGESDFSSISNKYWHWAGMYSIGKNAYKGLAGSNNRARRGYNAVNDWHDTGAGNRNAANGLRLVFEVTDPQFVVTPGVFQARGGHGGEAGEVTVMEVMLNEGQAIQYHVGLGGTTGNYGEDTFFGEYQERGHGGWRVENNDGANGGIGQDNGTGYGSGGGGGGGFPLGHGNVGGVNAEPGKDAEEYNAGPGGTGGPGHIFIEYFNGIYKTTCPWGANGERLSSAERAIRQHTTQIEGLQKKDGDLSSRDDRLDGRITESNKRIKKLEDLRAVGAFSGNALISATKPAPEADCCIWLRPGLIKALPDDWALQAPTPPDQPSTIMLSACADGEGHGMLLVNQTGEQPLKNIGNDATAAVAGEYVVVQ